MQARCVHRRNSGRSDIVSLTAFWLDWGLHHRRELSGTVNWVKSSWPEIVSPIGEAILALLNGPGVFVKLFKYQGLCQQIGAGVRGVPWTPSGQKQLQKISGNSGCCVISACDIYMTLTKLRVRTNVGVRKRGRPFFLRELMVDTEKEIFSSLWGAHGPVNNPLSVFL